MTTSPWHTSDVHIAPGSLDLPGTLTAPPGAGGLVIFAHGSGSSRFSPRNQFVAEVLHEAGMATLLFDLLTDAEACNRRLVFDIPLLAQRLVQAIEWASAQPATAHLPLGLFGASTGAAAALRAAAGRPAVRAVVSRGGRPDLAMDFLADVRAPTLLIVGEYDHDVLELNRQALERLTGIKQLVIVPRATHLFEEPGAMEEVSRLASRWFSAYLVKKESA